MTRIIKRDEREKWEEKIFEYILYLRSWISIYYFFVCFQNAYILPTYDKKNEKEEIVLHAKSLSQVMPLEHV